MTDFTHCPHCNGRGEYLCCNGFVEQCNDCLGTGRKAIATEAFGQDARRLDAKHEGAGRRHRPKATGQHREG